MYAAEQIALREAYDMRCVETVDRRTACPQKKQVNGCVKAPELTEFCLWELYDLLDPGERPSLRDRRRGISKNI
jgi:hypothetical protein